MKWVLLIFMLVLCSGLVFAALGDPGDANGDNKVDIFDLSMVASNIGKNSFNTQADLNSDNAVNLFDLVEVASNFGITYSSAPPPSGSLSFGPGANEPGGMKAFFDTDGSTKYLDKEFNSNAGAGSVFQYGGKWGNPLNNNEAISSSGNRVRIVTDNDPKNHNGKAIEVNSFAGDGDGFKGAAFWNNWRNSAPDPVKYPGWNGPIGDIKELYLRLVFKYSSNWQQHGSGITKIIYYGGGTGNQAAEFYPAFRGSAPNAKIQMRDQSGNGDDIIWRDGANNVAPYGQWNELEIYHLAQSSPGASDGCMRLWLNGKELTGMTPVPPVSTSKVGQPHDPIWQWVGFDNPQGFKGIQFGSFWGGSGSTKNVNDWHRWGGLYLSGKQQRTSNSC